MKRFDDAADSVRYLGKFAWLPYAARGVIHEIVHVCAGGLPIPGTAVVSHTGIIFYKLLREHPRLYYRT